MPDVKSQRLEYVQQTKESLLAAAETLFVREGFRATSIDAVGAAARFTKGAVYRHFADKEALFLAVFERVEVDIAQQLAARAEACAGPTEAALAALQRFLELATETRFRRIVLEEGPVALGWRRWRELDHQYTALLLERLLGDLADAGKIAPTSVGMLARLCCALAGEAAFQVAEADDPDRARADALATIGAMLGGLAAADPGSRG
jgi:AcrR family transcriptional regulator